MAQSMSADCTPLKLKYDSCFNAWLETYLSPELTSALSRDSRSGGHSSSSNSSLEDNNSNAKAQRTRKMAQEYESKCGEAWKAYNNCVTKAVKEHKLEDLIYQARKENPLRDLESHLDQTHSP